MEPRALAEHDIDGQRLFRHHIIHRFQKPDLSFLLTHFEFWSFAGDTRPEDMIPIYRKRTTIDSSGRETESQLRCVTRIPQRVLGDEG